MQLQNFLERYRQGERDFAHIDLRGAMLTGVNLRSINLAGANLTGANLSWASLSHANLTGACLHQADLHSTTLHNANLTQATLTRAKLTKADLRLTLLPESDLNWVDLTYCDLSGADLQRAKLNQANLQHARLNNALFMGAELMEANLNHASLIGANLSSANLREAQMEQANLREAILVGANLTEANLKATYLRACNFREADLHRAILTDADLSEANCDRADLSRANLSGAYLLKASLQSADLLRAILQDVYLLRTDLTQANLRGADLRRADLSAAYLKDTTLSEANLSDAYLLESYLIRTKLEQTELTGCCIHNWHLEDVDLSQVSCRYLFTQFNYTTKTPSDRYPAAGELQPGELVGKHSEDHLMVDVQFTEPPNWEALVFTLAQVELDCPNLKLTIKSYELTEGHYLLQLSASQLVNTKLVSQSILQRYPEIVQRFITQRQMIFDLLEIQANPNSKLEILPTSFVPPPSPPSMDHRRRIYQEVVNQIQRIIMAQAPEQFIESVQRLLEFLRQYRISTEEIQQKVIVQAIRQRIAKDPMFQKHLLQWEETADEAARFSLVGQSVRLAIALILSKTKSP